MGFRKLSTMGVDPETNMWPNIEDAQRPTAGFNSPCDTSLNMAIWNIQQIMDVKPSNNTGHQQ